VPADLTEGWQPLRAPGAFIKLLSFNRETGYAVVLGKLEPGTHYPAHTHTGPEELYMLSGDLKVGDYVLHAGDFHHSDPGTYHADNYSEHGCTLLAIISSQDVLQQMGVA
jgi:anti-sigma factor ChrR (cupin superfamily)